MNPDEAWRATPPKPGPDPRLAFPSLESFQLSNGLTVILDSRKGLPVVAASLDIRGGIAANPPDKPGLSAFMLDMLDEGTTTRPPSISPNNSSRQECKSAMFPDETIPASS